MEEDRNVQIEKEVDEYIIDKVYGCQTIITNCSVANLEFQILTEIPSGAIPVRQVEYTKSTTQTINSYSTIKLECYFYFPATGIFDIYPANVSRNEEVLSNANN